MPDFKFIVSLLTSRRDYDVAKVLHNSGLLDSMFTDLYYAADHKAFKLLDKMLPEKLAKVYRAYSSPLPDNMVHYNWPLGLEFRYRLKNSTNGAYYQAQINAYKKLSKKVIEYSETSKAEKNLAYFGFDTACLEMFRWASSRNCHLVMEQCVAPRRKQIQMHQHFATESKHMIQHCLHLQEREEQEWQLASTIIAPSPFVRNELVDAGAPEEKVKIVPFGFDSLYPKSDINRCIERRFANDKEIQVLFAGNAGYRKGIHDLLAVAQAMNKENVRFVIAGAVGEEVKKMINSTKTNNVSFLGKLSKAKLHEEYKKSDVFFFPSYLEGSAMVIFEAMSWGIPVVTTYESGSIIEHEHDGFICSAGQRETMKHWLGKLIHDSELRYQTGRNALRTSSRYTLAHYSTNLVSELTKQANYA